MIDEIRIVNAPGGIAVQQIGAGVVETERTYTTKEQAENAAHKAGVAKRCSVEDWTEVE